MERWHLNLQTSLLLLGQLMLAMVVQGAVQYHHWVVDYAYWSPDCVEKLVISVNGGFPGPKIRATVGDTIVVMVKNNMPTEGVVIHWHGIQQRGTPWADGVAFVSQCPINPGEQFTYKYTVHSAGTYFWHGHYGLQRAAGLSGLLIVDPLPGTVEPFTYDGELNVVLNDWWHRSTYEQAFGLSANPYHWVGEPQSLLIGGRGAYNCSLVPTGALKNSGDALNCTAVPQCSPYVLSVEPGKTYRMRVVNVASLSALNFILEGHNFTVVEADGNYVEPVQLSNLDLYSGEAYSVLFTADQDPSKNYWAGVNVRAREPDTPTGLAVLNYLPNSPTNLPTSPAPVSPLWNDTAYSIKQAKLYKARKGYIMPLPKRKTDRHIYLLNTQNKLGPRTRWAANNVSFMPTATPVLGALRLGIKNASVVTGENNSPPPEHFTSGYDIYHIPENPNTTIGSGYYEFKLNDVVDVVLQNANTLKANFSEIHPWHLHGHDFWVLGFGEGVFNASSYSELNYKDPPRRNTVPLFPYGWTYIRYVADNPGAWPFHCHIEMHLHLGMGVTFVEGVKQLSSVHVPQQALGCGLTKAFIDTP